MDPNPWPAVTDPRLLEKIPCATWHCTPVSAHHPVLSHAVAPNRTATVAPINPKLAPCTVMLADPVAALLPRLSKLIDALSADRADDVLPIIAPAVKTALRLPVTECPILQRTDDPDVHSVRSQDVSPSDDAAVYPLRPMLAPLIDTLTDPVAAPFTRNIPDTDPSSPEKEPVALPSSCPALTTNPRLPIAVLIDWHRTAESDSHAVLSQPVCPTLAS